MSKTHFPLTKETAVGLGLVAGVLVFFVINAVVVLSSMIEVYGAAKTPTGASAIDDTVLSQAVKTLNLDTHE